MPIAVLSNVAGGSDTTWIFSLSAKPGKTAVTLPLTTNRSNENAAVHRLDGSLFSVCAYSITAGSLHIDSWSETVYATGKLAKMSGGAAFTLTPDSPTSTCSQLIATLTFTDAAAANTGP